MPHFREKFKYEVPQVYMAMARLVEVYAEMELVTSKYCFRENKCISTHKIRKFQSINHSLTKCLKEVTGPEYTDRRQDEECLTTV